MKKFKFDLLVCFSILILCTIVYYHTLKYQLTYLDDNVWLLDYQWYLKDKTNLYKVFLKPDLLFGGLFYRPLIYFSFIIDTFFCPDSWLMYRITNLWLHGINSCLVYGLLRKLQYDKWIAAWAAFCFAVHPVLTQAVVWIPGRTDSLLALCVLVSFICFVHYLDTGRRRFIFFHLVFLVLSLLTKETAVALPCVCFLYLALSGRGPISVRRTRVLPLLWIMALTGYFWLRKFVLKEMSQLSLSLAVKSLLSNSPAVIGYLGKILIPVQLSVLPVLKDMSWGYGGVVLGILAVFCLTTAEKNWKKILFGSLWFLAFLLPSFIGSFLMHEYRVYIPMIGVMIMILETNVIQTVVRRFKIISVIPAVMIIIVLSRLTWANAQNYKDRHAFWDNAVQTSPHSPLAHRNRGAMYFLDQKFDEAQIEFEAARELNPKEFMVNNNLGLIYEIRGETTKAEEAYRREISINPTYDNVYYNLGLFYAKQPQYDLAVEAWEKAAGLNPRNLMARKYLAVYFTKTKNTAKAEFYINELKKQGVGIPADIEELIR